MGKDRVHEGNGKGSWRERTGVMTGKDRGHDGKWLGSGRKRTGVMTRNDRGHEGKGQGSWRKWTGVMKGKDTHIKSRIENWHLSCPTRIRPSFFYSWIELPSFVYLDILQNHNGKITISRNINWMIYLLENVWRGYFCERAPFNSPVFFCLKDGCSLLQAWHLKFIHKEFDLKYPYTRIFYIIMFSLLFNNSSAS